MTKEKPRCCPFWIRSSQSEVNPALDNYTGYFPIYFLLQKKIAKIQTLFNARDIIIIDDFTSEEV